MEGIIRPFVPHPQIILGGWNFAGTRPPPRPVGKKISVPQLPRGERYGGQRKNFPLRPHKIPLMYSPKIFRWLVLDAPYMWPKFGERSIGRFSARAKNAGFQRPGFISTRTESNDTPPHFRPESNVTSVTMTKF